MVDSKGVSIPLSESFQKTYKGIERFLEDYFGMVKKEHHEGLYIDIKKGYAIFRRKDIESDIFYGISTEKNHCLTLNLRDVEEQILFDLFVELKWDYKGEQWENSEGTERIAYWERKK